MDINFQRSNHFDDFLSFQPQTYVKAVFIIVVIVRH